ncbi:MAG: CobW-like GTP-binding protein [Anaerolineae bacterium]|nr:CobW-like GTP-binding protein [Anaerolineae bacterium]
MDLHIVGGFLGSGKTTAIIGGAKLLMARGLRVGVVTNDQGRYLVDTAFFRSEAVPTVEVTGGCFCCNYSDLDAQLDQLERTARPDAIFAESVGSCADIVATVVRPLLTLRRSDLEAPTSFTVFADARLLRRRLLGQPMPFSDDVVYVFDKQIEESGLLVANKVDLLSDDAVQELAVLADERFPDKRVRFQNSLVAEGVGGWLEMLTSGEATAPGQALDIDYARYGAGEAALAWLDERLVFEVSEGTGRSLLQRFFLLLLSNLRREGLVIGHLKFLVQSGVVEAKVSFPALVEEDWHTTVPDLPGTRVTLVVNARVESEPSQVRDLVQEAATVAALEAGATVVISDVVAFHPGFPKPTYRMQ